MTKPIIFYVDDNPQALELVREELEQRYTVDYQIICEASPKDATARVHSLKEMDEKVAILLADTSMPGMNGVEFLLKAQALFPMAKRGLLVDWGEGTNSDLIYNAISLNQADYYAPKPYGSSALPNEEFHNFISRFLMEWCREQRIEFTVFRIVGEQWGRRSYELRDLLNRNGISFRFYDVESEDGQALLEETGMQDAPLPVVASFNGRVLSDPSNADLAEVLGVRTAYDPGADRSRSLVDVVIVGAGPAGLSAAVNSASEGLKTVLIEREALGGQAGMSSRIRNYLGFPIGIPGDELASRAYQQAQLFGVETIFTQEAVELQVHDDARVVILSDGSEIPSQTVILATGASYRRLEIPSLEKLVGKGVYYGAVGSEAIALRGKDVFIVGGANSAGQAAAHLSKYARRVTMVVRNSSLSATMSEYLIREITACGNVDVLYRAEVVDAHGEYQLEKLEVHHKDTGEMEVRPAAALFVMIGARPHTGWLPREVLRDHLGFILTGDHLLEDGKLPAEWPLERNPFALETSVPGVFAVGDVRHRSVKRVASAVGEGSMGVQYIHQYLLESEKKERPPGIAE